MRTLLKLLLAAAVLYVAWRFGQSYWCFYQFEDGVQQAAQFAFKQDEAEVRSQVVSIGSRLGLTIDPDAVSVRKTMSEITVDLAYVDQVPILPSRPYALRHNLHVHAWLRP